MNEQQCTYRGRQNGKQCLQILYKEGFCQTHYEETLFSIMKHAIKEPLPVENYNLILEMRGGSYLDRGYGYTDKTMFVPITPKPEEEEENE